MTAVIRCPECQGLSRVDSAFIGQPVLCPRCDHQFLAEIDGLPSLALVAEHPAPPQLPDEPHELALTPILPASVLFGLALLPFIMPLAWIAGRILSGIEPNVSLAMPISLALAAATLSLAVVSTVDWTPATRIKGVLMIVGLAYFCGAMLFFLKKDAIEWVKRNIANTWIEFRVGNCSVLAPAHMRQIDPRIVALRDGWDVVAYQNEPSVTDDDATYTLAFGRRKNRWILLPKDKQAWLDQAQQAIEAKAGVKAEEVRERRFNPHPGHPGHPGRCWIMSLPDQTKRVVWICHVDETLYYLAVEGSNVSLESPEVETYFDSLWVNGDFP